MVFKKFKKLRSKQISLSKESIKIIALNIAEKNNIETFKGSKNWFRKFRNQFNLVNKRLCGDKAS
jgi:hypothetical protein